MARQLKPLRVDSYSDPKRTKVIDLMLDRDAKVFFAVVMFKRLSAPSLNELIVKVKAELAAQRPLEWRRVIQLGVVERDTSFFRGGRGSRIQEHGAGLEIHFSRKEVSATTVGRAIERPFREDLPAEWDHDDDLKYSNHADDSDAKRQIPYTEEAWATLNECVTALEKARARLDVLFNPKDGGRLLVARALGGVPLLGPGKD